MQTLRRSIRKYINRIIWISAFAMLVIMLMLQLMSEREKAYQDANRTFQQMEQVLAENETELTRIEEEYRQSCLRAAETASRILEGDPELLYSLDRLRGVAADIAVDEIHIFDKEGKIIFGTEPQYYGYTLDSGEQINFFKPMLADKSLKLVQDIIPNTAEGTLMQYSAVWSANGEFIVQVGMNPVMIIKMTEKNELSYIFSLFRVNPNVSYYAIDGESGVVEGANNLETLGKECSDVGFRFEDIKNTQKGFYSKIDGQYSFCVFRKIDTYYIGRVISIDNLYRNTPFVMLLTVAGLVIVSIILEISVMRYLDEYVVEKIHDVIQTLDLMAEGNMEERVDVQSSLEFQELSSYINQMVENLLKFNDMEQQVNETLGIALRAGNPETSLNIVLECLGKSLHGERSYIFEKNKQGGADNTYEWVVDGAVQEKDNLQKLSPEICAVWYERFAENKCVIYENIEDMREEDPLQYENLKSRDAVSIVVVPLYDGGNVTGFYGVDNTPVETLGYTTNMLRIMGRFIESLLAIRNLVRDLKEMSYLDQLTKIGNRHALWEYIDKMKMDNGVGIVYCDITGLKRVNDEEGHEAGDRLILSACECMKEALRGYALFRLGGDELLAVCSGISENEMRENVKRMEERMSEYAVVMAVGAVWKGNSEGEITSMMAEAETLMYQDKAAYYAATGMERRR